MCHILPENCPKKYIIVIFANTKYLVHRVNREIYKPSLILDDIGSTLELPEIVESLST